MAWQTYGLDRKAQKLVLDAKLRDKDSLNQSYKMRMAVAYGLERFWGEHLRLKKKEMEKANYWQAVWNKLHEILRDAKVNLPNDSVESNLSGKDKLKEETKKIQTMAKSLWDMNLDDQRIALMVLTQLCDSLVWWTQRYKVKGD